MEKIEYKQNFTYLFDNSIDCDVKFILNDKEILSHSNLILLLCPTFNLPIDKIIKIPTDLNFDVIKRCIRIMYQDKEKIVLKSFDELLDYVKVAKFLCFTSLYYNIIRPYDILIEHYFWVKEILTNPDSFLEFYRVFIPKRYKEALRHLAHNIRFTLSYPLANREYIIIKNVGVLNDSEKKEEILRIMIEENKLYGDQSFVGRGMYRYTILNNIDPKVLKDHLTECQLKCILNEFGKDLQKS